MRIRRRTLVSLAGRLGRHGSAAFRHSPVWTVAAAALAMVTLIGTGVVVVTDRSGGGASRERPAHAAPGQRWDSAAGQPHVVGASRNTTVPASLRSRYPLRAAVAAPAPPANPASVVEAPVSQARGFDPASSTEMPAARGRWQTTYANADGTETTQFSARPINFQGPDGQWSPVDTRLVPVPDGWRNGADALALHLAGRADDGSLARLDFGAGRTLSFGLAGAAPAAGRADGSTVEYQGVLPGTDLRLEAVSGGVKETLVLRSPAAPRTFRFPLRLGGLTPKLVSGQVAFVDQSGTVRAQLPSGYLTDSATGPGGPVVSSSMSYHLLSTATGPVLEVDLDGAWLADPARVYPVTVDPSVDSVGADSSMTVHGGSSTSAGGELLIGDEGGAPAAAYLAFNGLADRLRLHNIFGVQLQLFNFDAASCAPRPMTVHPVTQAWTAGGGFAYPGPSVGPALVTSSFAYGAIASGQSASACPGRQVLVNLGTAGRDMVQGWVDGQPNFGISLRASPTDPSGWKRFAGSTTANPPRLFVTHSPYNAAYAIPDPVPKPPVLQNQAGKVKVTVQNLGAETWTPGTYYLAYRAYRTDTGAPVTQQRAANLTGNVARGARATLDATIQPLPPGRYFLDFTMVRTGGVVFTDQQVPPARIVLQVFDIPPVVQELDPPNGFQAPTLTPQLWARAVDIDAPPGSSLTFSFTICEGDGSGSGTNCRSSGELTRQAWTVPSGWLSWSRTYQWRATVKDGSNTVNSPWSVLLTWVPQPAFTSRVASAPYASTEHEFDPQTGNVSTAAVDASVGGAGPRLAVVRTYNSLDPRRDLSFGAGWVTQFDMRLVPDDDGSGNVVVTYPDGQQVRFGRNPDGTFAAPQGRLATLALTGGLYRLSDRAGTVYDFSATGRLARIADADQRSIVLSYNPNDGRLSKATLSVSQNGGGARNLFFTWTGGHVSQVRTDPLATGGPGLAWIYSYTGDLLASVCDPQAACTTYTYATGSHYRSAVLDSLPQSYYRLGESEGTGASSEVAVNLGTDAASYTTIGYATPGAVAGSTDTAVTFNGSTSTVALPKGALKVSRDGAVELWFRIAASQTGGPLIGYQDQAITGTPTTGVPVLYVGTDGKLRGQFATGTVNPITSAGTVNDNRWHHAVLSAMGSSQTLYLDGVSVGRLDNQTIDHANLTANQLGAGYAASPASWPGWGSSARRFFSGSVDEVALYPHPLGSVAVAAHYAQGRQAADQLTRITLPSGKVAASITYDVAKDRVKEFVDRNGGGWTVRAPAVFGGAGDLRRSVEVLDPARRSYLYEYDALAGRLLRSGSPVGLSTRDEDQPVQPSASPDPSPTQTCTTPDPGDPEFCTVVPPEAGGPVFVRRPLDGMAIRSVSYDQAGLPATVTDENGDAVGFSYDARGRLTSRRTCRASNDCATAYYSYPAVGANPLDPRLDLPTEYRDARSSAPTDNRFRTQYTYAPGGELATQTNPDNSTVTNRYTTGAEPAVGGGATPPGLLATSTDPRGAVTRYAYTAAGDLAQVTEPSGLVCRYDYDPIGRRVKQTEVSDSFPNGVVTAYAFDGDSHPVGTTYPATTDPVTGTAHQLSTTLGYDPDGNPVRAVSMDLLTSDPQRVTTMDYDDRGRLSRVVDSEGGETSYSYDQFGNRTSTVDAEGNRLEYAYTNRNAVAEVRLRNWTSDPTGSPAPSPGDYLVLDSYAYDFAGRTVRHSDAMGHRYEYGYYGDGTVSTVTLRDFHNPDGSTRDLVVSSNTYDGAGNLVKQISGNGTVVTAYSVDALGRVDSVTVDPGGLDRRTAYRYDAAGNVTRVTVSGQPSNVPWAVPTAASTVDYTYDLAGRKTAETVNAAGSTSQVTRFGYDQRGLLVSQTDPRGTVAGANPAAYTTVFGHDERGQLVSTVNPPVLAERRGEPAHPVNSTVTTGYNAFGDAVTVRDPLGNVSTSTVDRLGRPTATTLPAYLPPGSTAPVTAVIRTGYDRLGNVTSTTDPLGHVTRRGYDQLSRLVLVDRPAGSDGERAVWRYGYIRTGQLVSVAEPTGAVHRATYDDLGRQITSTDVERVPHLDNLTTTFGYDDAGRQTGVTSPNGAGSTMTYDPAGELVRRSDPAGVTTQYGYDFAGRQVRTADALGRTARQDFDALGRLATVTALSPSGTALRTVRYGYDPAGNRTSVTDALQRTTTYEYDAANRLTRQVEPVTATTSTATGYGYDEAGDRTRQSDGNGHATIWTFNALGLPESIVEPATAAQPDPGDRTWSARYDAGGRLVRLTAPGGVVRDRTFDAAGRLVSESGTGGGADPASRRYGYDLGDRLTQVDAPGGSDTVSYDDRGLVVATGGPSGSSSFAYNPDGQLTSRIDASGTTSYGYLNGRLSTVADPVSGVTQAVGYDAAGAVNRVEYGSGRVRSFGYDDLGRTASDTLRNPGGATVYSVSYGYDPADQLVSKSTTGTAGSGDNRYAYDLDGRLTSWTSAGRTTSYGWDGAGNRTAAGAVTFSYDERNRLLSDGTSNYTYTPRGTLAARTGPNGNESFSFDAFDRLTARGGQARYGYDGLDRVVTRNGAVFSYSGTGDTLASDSTERYGRGPNGQLISVANGQSNRVLLGDRHGDVVGGFDPGDTALDSLDDSTGYDPFGTVTAHTGTATAVGFQGDWTDPAGGQVDMGARWYDPRTGAFLSRDDLDQATGARSALANRYSYGAAAPTGHIDPTGHAPCDIDTRTLTPCLGDLPDLKPLPSPGKAWGSGRTPPHDSVPGGGGGTGSGGGGSSGGPSGGGGGGGSSAGPSAGQLTARARNAERYAAQHNPQPNLRASTQPLYAGSGSRPPVSSSPDAPAGKVGTSRNVVADQGKASHDLYTQLWNATGPVVRDMPRASTDVALAPPANNCGTTGYDIHNYRLGDASIGAIPTHIGDANLGNICNASGPVSLSSWPAPNAGGGGGDPDAGRPAGEDAQTVGDVLKILVRHALASHFARTLFPPFCIPFPSPPFHVCASLPDIFAVNLVDPIVNALCAANGFVCGQPDPDFITVGGSVSKFLFGVGGSVTVTRTGRIYLSVSESVGLSPPFPTASITGGYIYQRKDGNRAPRGRIDGFVSGQWYYVTTPIGSSVNSPGAPDLYGYDVGPSANLGVSQSYAVQIQDLGGDLWY
jgi:RHS repeat-associated protein